MGSAINKQVLNICECGLVHEMLKSARYQKDRADIIMTLKFFLQIGPD
jgi:hypothetical protein